MSKYVYGKIIKLWFFYEYLIKKKKVENDLTYYTQLP